jgi:hypothetical protein
MKRIAKSMMIIFALAAVGCSDAENSNESEDDEQVHCERVEVDGEEYCVYGTPITETGYDCPQDLPNAISMGGGTVCSRNDEVPDDHRDPLEDHVNDANSSSNSNPNGNPNSSNGSPDPPNNSPNSATPVDILWVIDNSASMCSAQRALRDNFGSFASNLEAQDVDFQIAVTTTQMQESPRETVAQAGNIQSMPQPVPAPSQACVGEAGSDPDGTDGYQAFRETLEAAVNCTKDPAQWQHLLDVTNAEIECHLQQQCNGEDAQISDLFPTGPNGERPNVDMSPSDSPYRNIPRVLSADDFRKGDGEVDLDRLERDFACMSMVGTRGHWVEKGLSAAVKAVSPDMTGGPVENPTDASAPNHGLVREDSDFALIFLTDENDCSHDGSLNEGSACGDSVCAFAQHPDVEDQSGLISVDTLADDFIANLDQSKGPVNFGGNNLLLASFHGDWNRYGETSSYPEGQPMHPDDCTDSLAQMPPDDRLKQPSCQTSWGTAYSGDRYDRFFDQFSQASIFPQRPSSDEPMPGLMCEPDQLGDKIELLGETIAASAQTD